MQSTTSIRQKKENTFILQVLIVLACMNFLGHGSLFFLLASLYELFRRRFQLLLDSNMFALLLFVFFSLIACAAYYSLRNSLKLANYFLVYLIGYNGYRQSENPKKFIASTAFSICLGFGLELILMYIYNLDLHRQTIRSMYSIWTGELIAVTLLGLLVSAVTGFSFYAFFCTKNPVLKIIVALLLAAGIWIGIDTATRTPPLLLVVVYVVMGILYLRSKKGKFLNVLLVIVSICLLSVILYQNDFLGIKTFYMGTPLYARFEATGTESSRLKIAQRYMSLMPKYPWGGLRISRLVGIKAHNFLQEGYDLYGILAFVPLLVVTFQIIGNFGKLATKKNKADVDFLLASMYLALFLQMCLEPVFHGYPILIWSILLLHGAASAYLKDSAAHGNYLSSEESV